MLRDTKFVMEQRRKRQSRGGLFYQSSEIRVGMARLRFRVEAAILGSGTTDYFVMSSFQLAGMQVVAAKDNRL